MYDVLNPLGIAKSNMPRAILLILTCGLSSLIYAADWPKFNGPTGDCKSPEKGVLKQWPQTGPPLVWQVETGEGYCAPAVADGRLFLFDRAGDKQRLRCLAPRTGQPKWVFEYPTSYQDLYGYDGGPRACPVVDGDRVYTLGPEGMLHCLAVTDGSVKWKLDVVKRFGVVQNFFGAGATPVIEGDLLIMQVGGSPPDSPPTISGKVPGNGSGIVAFNKLTGGTVYQITDELASYSVPVPATIGDRRWCFVFARGGLVGFEPKSGKVDFHYPWRAPIIESVNASNPVVVGDQVLVSECYGVGASLLKVRPGGYEIVWKDDGTRRPALATHWMTPIEVGGYIYASSGRHSGGAELRCVELQTGKVMWSIPRLTRSSLLYVDDHFVVLTEFGQLLLVRATAEKFDVVTDAIPRDTQGRELLEHPSWAAPVLANGLLYLRGKGRLICLRLIPEK